MNGGYSLNDGRQTPEGVIRLTSPKNNEEYARTLYAAFRLADEKKLDKVFAVPPIGGGIAVAINDRLFKSAFNNDNVGS